MRSWLALPFVLLAASAPAQGPQPSAMPAITEPDTLPGEQLAFETFETRMTVPVDIAGAGPFRFVVDTGAQRTVISRQLAATLGLANGRNVRLTAMSGTTNVGTVVIPRLSVSTLGGERIEAPALDARNLGASGLIGIDSLQGHTLSIDFDSETMAVTPASRRGTGRRADPDEIVVQARSMFGQLVVTNAYIGRLRVRVILDTGTPVSMGNLALLRRVARGDDGAHPVSMTSVTGGVVIANYAIMRDIKIGEATINDLPVAFSDAPPFRAFGLSDKPAILLGMDALKLFRRVHIDFANRQLRLALPKGTIQRSFRG